VLFKEVVCAGGKWDLLLTVVEVEQLAAGSDEDATVVVRIEKEFAAGPPGVAAWKWKQVAADDFFKSYASLGGIGVVAYPGECLKDSRPVRMPGMDRFAVPAEKLP